MMNKVIFLDVDGVLNTWKTIQRFGMNFIDPVLVCLVERIVRETGASIVLSSSWRLDARDKAMVDEALNARGLVIVDCTPYHSAPMKWIPRNEEILSWLKDKNVSRFAILDDCPSAEIVGSFFQTDDSVGLTVAIAERVISHLNGE